MFVFKSYNQHHSSGPKETNSFLFYWGCCILVPLVRTERGSSWNILVAKCLSCLSFAGTSPGIRLLCFPTALGLASLPPLRLSLSQHLPVFSSWQTSSSSDPHAGLLLPLFLDVSTGHSPWVPSPPWPEQVRCVWNFPARWQWQQSGAVLQKKVGCGVSTSGSPV